METFTLLPYPRNLVSLPGNFAFSDHHFIAIDSPDPLKLFLSGRNIQKKLNGQGIHVEIIAGCHASEDQIDIILRLLPDSTLPPQGYQLQISPQRVVIESSDEAGIFYGVCTLQQLLACTHSASLPCMMVSDWPDFPARGVMLDISRDKVYTLDTLLVIG